MSEVNITFSTADGMEMDYEGSELNVPDSSEGVTFVRVSVKSGTWILYKKPGYNPTIQDSDSPDNIDIVKAGTEKDLFFSPGSIWKAVDTRETAIVFEHADYGGNRYPLENYGSPDISQLFPPGEAGGASSLIIWPNKKWELFVGKKYTGLHRAQEPGWYRTPEEMQFPNDTLQSIRPR